MRVTVKMLEREGACCDSVARFKKQFPRGVALNTVNVARYLSAGGKDSDGDWERLYGLDWLLNALLSSDAQDDFIGATDGQMPHRKSAAWRRRQYTAPKVAAIFMATRRKHSRKKRSTRC